MLEGEGEVVPSVVFYGFNFRVFVVCVCVCHVVYVAYVG